MNPKKNDGVISLPLGLFMGLSAMFGFSFLLIGNYWNFKVKTQLRLDRCAGSAAVELRNHLNTISRMNHQIDLIRLGGAAALASGNTSTIAASKESIHLVVLLQEKELLAWRKRQFQWFTSKESSNFFKKKPLPEIPVIRKAPDILGEKPLEWVKPKSEPLEIVIASSNRMSRSFVFRDPIATNDIWISSWRPSR